MVLLFVAYCMFLCGYVIVQNRCGAVPNNTDSSFNVKYESGSATNSTKSLVADKKGQVEKHLHACDGDTTTARVHCSDSDTYSPNAKPSTQSIIF